MLYLYTLQYSPKRPVENVANPESNSRSTPGRKGQTSKGKRQKKTNDGGQSAVLEQLDTKMSCAFCHYKETEVSSETKLYIISQTIFFHNM